MANNSRIERARVRARGAKVHAPGHTKGKPKPLAAPKSFERAVKRSIAEGGVIEPPAQPPPVATSTS